MLEHIKAWDREYKSSIWRGHYSLDPLGSICKGRLLDAGCGSGKYAIPLRMRGFSVTGVDASKEGLKMALKGSKCRELDIKFLAADIRHLPFADASFDFIWCYGVLQHLLSDERKLAINEFRRLLCIKGRLFIEVMGENDLRYGGTEIEPNTFKRKRGIIYHYFNKNEIEDLLHGFSCRILESEKEKRFDGRVYLRHVISVIAERY